MEAAARLYAWAADDGLAGAAEALARVRAAAAAGAEPVGDDALAAGLDRVAEVLDALGRDAPRSRIDPVAVLQAAGPSVEALTGWVADNVALVGYRGSLRGARGALLDRHANSLDRALLLAELLGMAGYQVRLAHATLDAASAAALRDASAVAIADDPAPDRAATVARLAEAAGDALAPLAETVARETEGQRALAETVDRRSDTIAADLLAALGERGTGASGDFDAALADHWWVQVAEGDGWVDADPSAALVAAPAAQESFAADALPDALQHRVTLRLVVEFWEQGRLREQTVMTEPLVPAALIGRPVVLRHIPMSAPPAASVLSDTPADLATTALAAAADAWVWQPVLTVGDEALEENLFTTRGEVLPAGPETLRGLGIGTGIFGDLGDRLGTVFDEQPAEPASPPDEATAPLRLTAEWLEFTVEVPGAPAAVHRRPVFDLIGPAARAAGVPAAPAVGPAERLQRALGMMREVDILVTGAALPASFVRATMGRDAAALLRALPALLGQGPDAAVAPMDTIPRIQLPLYRHALLRQDSRADAQPYLDRPNIVLAWSGWAGTGRDDLRATLLYDIVENGVGTPAGADGFAARLAQGVRDTVAEDALAGPGPTGNAAALFEADMAAGQDWVVVRPGDAGTLRGLALADDVRTAIAAQTEAGAVVLAPPAPVATLAGPQVAWWRIDPATGTTLGMNLAGGAAMTERAVLLAQGVQVGGCFVALGMAISGGMGGVAVGAALCIAGGITSAVAIVDGAAMAALIGASVALGGTVAAAVAGI
ncbi:MAG: hypothetical protein R3F55_00655 [Alphaproteobacteria bacterium]